MAAGISTKHDSVHGAPDAYLRNNGQYRHLAAVFARYGALADQQVTQCLRGSGTGLESLQQHAVMLALWPST
jgi:hypothetical protein